MSASASHHVDQAVAIIPDRFFLASYHVKPKENTPFVYPDQESPEISRRSPSRKAAPKPPPRVHKSPFYFNMDDELLYNAFFHDFGPLHISHLYRFALSFHKIMEELEGNECPIVYWTKPDPRSRANAACLLACYMVLIQNWHPHLALGPFAQIEPPLMPFRDAGYSQADYALTVQDVVYGVWKAKESRCIDLHRFDPDLYEMFERVENGDFNWITPDFLAFASPQSSPAVRFPEGSRLYEALPRSLEEIFVHPNLDEPFQNVLAHFSTNNIGLVVRLNSHLYSPSYFEALGIQHIDMVFSDGTCPPLRIVRRFIRMAHEMITVKKKAIAVHCKAGLGRTGCLIGAYLIYRYGFTANEVIAFMRFMRPGMVVGPQQHWLHLNQGTFREWRIEERIEAKLRREIGMSQSAAVPSTPIRSVPKTSRHQTAQTPPPNRSPSSRTPLSEVDDRSNVAAQDDYLPAPTPGQPRKTARIGDRHNPHQRQGNSQTNEKEAALQNAAEAASSVKQARPAAESDEEAHLRMKSHRKSSNQPSPSHATRSSTEQTRTRPASTRIANAVAANGAQTASAYKGIDNDASHDTENINSRPLAKVRSSKRTTGSDSALRSKEGSGVRKTSGRVGSIGNVATSATAAATARKVSATGA
ncbi:protein-tyrosine phosphatase [Ceratocystis lukuohia]|uniref:protein-tyrosine-phosphatase n=1 Tax=Ceratocystis lukuohia TaxID=2019550 RepID=A0ABR4MET1_9PEZI